ncbi:gastrula zinc finger protein XlCGF58.1-like [Diabrotica virgifera virgifera]|uniref:Gastrula zinc finger protein XlCGF58.1-like n=1 Tax=Diabrotica virgifera virgifera TaxID=50390 RepID=A0A6P7HAD5_DIAVI|nr:gastrula zinc finger protein XlCGF58.1-like [Diabrotica virgifera virgifera]
MDNYKNISDQSNTSACFVCAIKENLCIVSENLEENDVFMKLFKLEPSQEIKRYICVICLKPVKEICQFIYITQMKRNLKDNNMNDVCKVCFQSEKLISFPPHLLDVFRSIFYGEVKYNCSEEYICNKCLIELENISNFILFVKSNKESIIYKIPVKYEFSYTQVTEDIVENKEISKDLAIVKSVEIKEEPLQDDDDDDIFEETESLFKNEDASVKFENNNNFDLKAEEIKIEDYKEFTHPEDYHLHPVLKCEVEDEGIQCNYDEIIPLKCSVCGRSFKTTRDLVNHLQQRLRCRYQVPFVAQYWKSFVQKVAKPFRCLVCLKYFSSVKRKIDHIKQHFKAGCVVCPICGKLFTKEKEYYNHFRHHLTKQLPLKCKSCPRKFPTKLIYLKHLTKHKQRKKKQYRCVRCKQPLSSEMYLRKHLKKTVKCPYCDAVFCIKAQLASHLRSHIESERYQCAECSRSFNHKGNLVKHCRTHTGYRPCVCKICLKGFSRIDYLRKHYISIHNQEMERTRKQYTYKKKRQMQKQKENSASKSVEGFSCDICNKTYPSKTSLSSHIRVHNSGKSFQCNVCGKSFAYKGLLNGHMKIHLGYKPFACTLCPKTFIKRNDLTRHTFTHTKERNFRCEICYQAFARKDVLRLHLRNHTGQRPYQCDGCLKTFTQKSNMTHHLKRCKAVDK